MLTYKEWELVLDMLYGDVKSREDGFRGDLPDEIKEIVEEREAIIAKIRSVLGRTAEHRQRVAQARAYLASFERTGNGQSIVADICRFAIALGSAEDSAP